MEEKLDKPNCCKNCQHCDYDFDYLDNLDNMYIYCLLNVWLPWKKQECKKQKPYNQPVKRMNR